MQHLKRRLQDCRVSFLIVFRECRVTDLAESLDLNLPIDEWADVVLEKQSTIRKNTIDDIKKSGFDVKQNVVKLEEFYLNSVEE